MSDPYYCDDGLPDDGLLKAFEEAKNRRAAYLDFYQAKGNEVAANITEDLRRKGVLGATEYVVFNLRVARREHGHI